MRSGGGVAGSRVRDDGEVKRGRERRRHVQTRAKLENTLSLKQLVAGYLKSDGFLVRVASWIRLKRKGE